MISIIVKKTHSEDEKIKGNRNLFFASRAFFNVLRESSHIFKLSRVNAS